MAATQMQGTATEQGLPASGPDGSAGFDASAEPQSPLARLTPEQIEQLGREFDAIHDEVYADLGERDSRYIRATIALHRRLVLASRVALLFSRRKPAWLAGTAMLSLA